MLEGAPSQTAVRVARRRAVHQLLDRPLVFEDPIALRLAAMDDAEAAAAVTDPGEQRPVARALRAFLAARSRFAEEHLAVAIGRGVRQYVILGAGLDTFAYRHSYGSALTVFEVDFPATQAWKRERLAAAGIDVPPTVIYVPIDFGRQTAFEALHDAGFDTRRPAYCSWLGVTMYLTDTVVMAVLREAASLPPGSGISFDYSVDPACLSGRAREAAAELARRAAAAGEPWTLAFEPAALVARVQRLGFAEVEDLGGDEINGRYFANRSDGLRVGSLARLLHAST